MEKSFGNISFFSRMFIFVSLIFASTFAHAKITEVERIRAHLKLVESLLRLQDSSSLTKTQQQNREQGLDHLHAYWMKGDFPRNTQHPGRRQPYFIDAQGVPCAVAEIMIRSGHEDLAQKISRTQNFSYLEEIEIEGLQEWIEDSGFTSEELRLIQPGYAYSPRSEDAFVEAAFLGDIETVQRILDKNLLSADSKVRRVNEALRAAVPEMTAESTAEIAKRNLRKYGKVKDSSPGIYYESPPFQGHGREVVAILLKAGADPNDRSNNRPSIATLSRDSETDKVLEAHGAKWSDAERLLQLIDRKDVSTIEALLKKSGADFYEGVPQPQPFTMALRTAVYMQREFKTPLLKSKEPGDKLVALLVQHIPKQIRWEDETSFELIVQNRQWNVLEEYLKAHPKVASAQKAALTSAARWYPDVGVLKSAKSLKLKEPPTGGETSEPLKQKSGSSK